MPTFKRVNEIEGKATAYGVKDIAPGEAVKLEGHLAEKAERNPNYELVNDQNRAEKQSAGDHGKAGVRSNRKR